MVMLEVTILNPSGLHAKPIIDLSKLVKRFKCEIRVVNGAFAANPRSFFSMVEGEFAPGVRINIEADGEDEREAVKAVRDFIEGLRD